MKHLQLSILFVGLLVAGCYDDSTIKEDISDLQKRVSNLEALCTQINTNLVGIQTLVNSLNSNDYITSVTPIKNGEETIGYTITFLKSAPITIYNGKDGSNGADGKTPQIGVKQDVDGVWYWTLGDNWLLDSDGQKVRASGMKGDKGDDGSNGENGKDAIAPKLTIVEGYWYLSTDNGKTWTNIGKATGDNGKDGDSMFKNVTYDDKYAYFTLVNGTVLTIPLSTNLPKLQFTLDKESDLHVTGGGTIVLNYTIISPTGAQTTFKSYESQNWKVQINKTSATKGTITITAPNPVESGKILLALSDDYGNVFIKVLEIIGDDNIIKIIKDEYIIDEYGGYIEVAVEANLGFAVQILNGGEGWISTVSSGAITRLAISPNSNYSSRTATVRFKGNDGETYKDITITQLQNNAIVVSSNQINISENAQTYNLIVRSNVDCKLTIPGGSNWISDITTKSLVDKTFTLSVLENGDYAPRSVDLIVSDLNDRIKQTITITQAGYTPVYISIPDAIFRSCLVENYDINGDGLIDQKEAANVTAIDCSGKSISSLSGIASFTNLATLDCSKTNITTLDLTANTNLTSIMSQYNEQMTTLLLPPNLKTINARAFISCTGLRELDLPNSITSIGEDAFLNCSSLNKLTIRSDINTTYFKSFKGAAIKSLLVTDNCSESPVFRVCTTLESLRIEGDVQVIPAHGFDGCTNLKTVSLGENVMTINVFCFDGCNSLETFIADKYSRLKIIQSRVFTNCSSLKLLDFSNCTELITIETSYSTNYWLYKSATDGITIKLGARTPPTTSYTENDNFYPYSGTMLLFVPSDCIEVYKSSKWYNSSYVTINAL